MNKARLGMQPMSHDVSAIVSCYKGERYLPRFLQNYSEQSFFDRMEMVIDMNLPSAEELSIVQKFQDEHPGRLRVLTTDKLLSFGASWNRCIQASEGEHITIWNSDDLRTPTSIERQVETLSNGSDVAYGDYTVVNEFGSSEGRKVSFKGLLPEQFTRKFYLGPFFMFRRSLLNKAGMVDEQFMAASDFDLGVRLAFNGRVKRTDGGLGYYLDAGKGLSTRPDSPARLEATAICLRYGVYDEIDFSLLPRLHPYNIFNALYDDAWHHVSAFVSNYEGMLVERYARWFDIGALYHFTSALRTEDRGLGRFAHLMSGRSRKKRGPDATP